MRGFVGSQPRVTAHAVFVLAVTCCAALVAPRTFAYQTSVYAGLIGQAAAGLYTVAALAAGLRAEGQPLRASLAIVRGAAPRVLPALTGLVLLMAAFTTLKTAFPAFVPFYADRALAAADVAVLGQHAWSMVHGLVGPIGREALWFLYGGPWFAWWIGTALFAIAMPPSGLRTAYLRAFALKIVLLGVVAATLCSSAGPVFYDRLLGGDAFADLAAMLTVADGGTGAFPPDYLWENHVRGGVGIGTGISAFPSIHCAGAFLNALFWGRIDRRLGAAGWAFAGLIWLGSMVTGWHYASDGVASLIGVLLIWRAVAPAREGQPARSARRTARRFAIPISVSVGTKPSS